MHRKEITFGLFVIERTSLLNLNVQIESHLFYKVRMTLDFSKSENIEFQFPKIVPNNKLPEVQVLPCKSTTLAVLSLKPDSKVVYTVTFQLEFPELQIVEPLIIDLGEQMDLILDQTSSHFESMEFSSDNLQGLFKKLSPLCPALIDHDFPPIDESVFEDPDQLEQFLEETFHIIHWRKPSECYVYIPLTHLETNQFVERASFLQRFCTSSRCPYVLPSRSKISICSILSV